MSQAGALDKHEQQKIQASPPRSSAAADAEPKLLFDRVSKWYGPVMGLNQVTLELREGITGLVGPNGAGKSTFMRLAAGQLRPDLGTVAIVGQDAWTAAAKRLVGYCPSSDVFYEDMTGRAFVDTMARLSGYRRSDAQSRTERVLDIVGMQEAAGRKIGGYSKGMRQRIKLAQALVHDPALLLLDEPMSGIDPIGRQEMIALFQKLATAGKCLLVSSHELEELEKLTNHIAVMVHGRIAAVGPLERIRTLLDDQPLSILIKCSEPRKLAAFLVASKDVVGVELGQDEALVVRARNARQFYRSFTTLVLEENLDILHLEALDDSAAAVLGYLLGGRP